MKYIKSFWSFESFKSKVVELGDSINLSYIRYHDLIYSTENEINFITNNIRRIIMAFGAGLYEKHDNIVEYFLTETVPKIGIEKFNIGMYEATLEKNMLLIDHTHETSACFGRYKSSLFHFRTDFISEVLEKYPDCLKGCNNHRIHPFSSKDFKLLIGLGYGEKIYPCSCYKRYYREYFRELGLPEFINNHFKTNDKCGYHILFLMNCCEGHIFDTTYFNKFNENYDFLERNYK